MHRDQAQTHFTQRPAQRCLLLRNHRNESLDRLAFEDPAGLFDPDEIALFEYLMEALAEIAFALGEIKQDGERRLRGA